MADRPIPFSAPMVLALLAGSKTETRRVLNAGPERLLCRSCGMSEKEFKSGECTCDPSGLEWTPCDQPRNRIGDRLYVREEIQAWQTGPYKYVRYAADQKEVLHIWPPEWKRDAARPMHMFKRFSRMTLPVISVRVERLHDITQEGAIAEGIERVTYEQSTWEMGVEPSPISIYKDSYGWRDYADHPHAAAPFHHDKAVLSYKSLWESINGEGSWDRNPWVCVTAWSHVIHQNIDSIQP